MQAVVDKWRKEKHRHPLEDAWLRRMGPAHFGHVNFRGMLTFSIDKYVDALLRNQEAAKRRARG
jgi:hypothetical protein